METLRVKVKVSRSNGTSYTVEEPNVEEILFDGGPRIGLVSGRHPYVESSWPISRILGLEITPEQRED